MAKNHKNQFSTGYTNSLPYYGWKITLYGLGSIFLLLFLCSLPGCTGKRAPSNQTEITVFAAASLNEPFQQISQQFQAQHAGVKVTLVFAGSQQLVSQINEGAAADVFASASTKQMEALEAAGKVQAGQSRFFASNWLVVVAPAANPAGLADLTGLAAPGLRLVLAAAEVPVGQYTLEFLDKATQENTFGSGFKQAVLNNVVSYENDVKAVLNKVVLNEADAGIVYHSDVSPAVADKVIQLDIPDELNVVARYPIAVLAGSEQADMAQAFVDFVLSPAGQAVLAEAGFIPEQP